MTEKTAMCAKSVLHLGELGCSATSDLGNAELLELPLQLLKLLQQTILVLFAQCAGLNLGYKVKIY